MKLHILTIASSSIMLSATLLSSTAQAQSAAQPDELQAIYACKSISNPQERLACYDNSVDSFEAAEKSGEVVTVSKTAIEEVERNSFGFNIPSLKSLGGIFGGKETSKTKTAKSNDLTDPVKETAITSTPDTPSAPPAIKPKPKTSDIKEVSLEIRKTTEFGYKKTRFFMVNGQVWEQIDTTRMRIPKAKKNITHRAHIKKAALGSYLLQINGEGAAIRVRRVR